MEPEPEQGHDAGKAGGDKPGRGWTSRFKGPIRYRRFTDIDAGGRPAIFFKFEQAPGQTDLPQEVYDILHQMKHLDRGSDHGGGKHHTNLTFKRSKKHGRVYRLDDNPTGRTTADIIDAKLRDLAHELESHEKRSR